MRLDFEIQLFESQIDKKGIKDMYHHNLSGEVRSFQNRVRTLAVANLMFKLNQKVTRPQAPRSASSTSRYSSMHSFSV